MLSTATIAASYNACPGFVTPQLQIQNNIGSMKAIAHAMFANYKANTFTCILLFRYSVIPLFCASYTVVSHNNIVTPIYITTFLVWHAEVCYVQCIPLWEVSLVLPQYQACSVTKVHWVTLCCFESVLTHQGASEDESSSSHPKKEKGVWKWREEGEERKRG